MRRGSCRSQDRGRDYREAVLFTSLGECVEDKVVASATGAEIAKTTLVVEARTGVAEDGGGISCLGQG